mmetsp:Transcript_113081/g.365241  ORF Transcript_113081/g.365241 Transcript_113081/m.365241 type:complete len:321 (+) Transcript_113081:116-1078(+)
MSGTRIPHRDVTAAGCTSVSITAGGSVSLGEPTCNGLRLFLFLLLKLPLFLLLFHACLCIRAVNAGSLAHGVADIPARHRPSQVLCKLQPRPLRHLFCVCPRPGLSTGAEALTKAIAMVGAERLPRPITRRTGLALRVVVRAITQWLGLGPAAAADGNCRSSAGRLGSGRGGHAACAMGWLWLQRGREAVPLPALQRCTQAHQPRLSRALAAEACGLHCDGRVVPWRPPDPLQERVARVSAGNGVGVEAPLPCAPAPRQLRLQRLGQTSLRALQHKLPRLRRRAQLVAASGRYKLLQAFGHRTSRARLPALRIVSRSLLQ